MRPVYAQQILRGVIVKFQFALIGIMNGCADTARKVNVGGGYQHRIVFLLGCHDSFQGVFGFFSFFNMTSEIQDLITMMHEKIPMQGHKTCWVVLMNSLTGWAAVLMCCGMRLNPLPPSLMKYRATLRTDGWFRRFAFGLIGVVDSLLKHAIVTGNLMITGEYVFLRS
jgi:hypothetical protein